MRSFLKKSFKGGTKNSPKDVNWLDNYLVAWKKAAEKGAAVLSDYGEKMEYPTIFKAVYVQIRLLT